jgi:hypothetical protein
VNEEVNAGRVPAGRCEVFRRDDLMFWAGYLGGIALCAWAYHAPSPGVAGLVAAGISLTARYGPDAVAGMVRWLAS